VRADRVQLRLEGAVAAQHRLDGQRGGEVGHREQVARVRDREQEHAEHPVGTVDEGEAFLGRELDRAQAGDGQRLGSGDPRAVLPEHPALAEQHERAVRQGRQIAGRAQRAVLRYPWGDVVVEQVDQRPRDERPDARAAQRQRPCPQQDHRPHHLARHRRPDAGRVRTDQRVLQFGPARRIDERVGERAEPRGHPVDRAAALLDRVDDGAAGRHRVDRGVGQLDRGVVTRDGGHVGGGYAAGLDGDGVHIGSPLSSTAWISGTPGR
jgi:hypothetical protein